MPLVVDAFEGKHKESILMATILTGYGEIEWEFVDLARVVLNRPAIQSLYRIQSGPRNSFIDGILRPYFRDIGYHNDYCEFFGALRICRTLRNRYAHGAHWCDVDGKISFLNIEDGAKKEVMAPIRYLIDLSVLEAQEKYFTYTRNGILYLQERVRLASNPNESVSRKPDRVPKPPDRIEE